MLDEICKLMGAFMGEKKNNNKRMKHFFLFMMMHCVHSFNEDRMVQRSFVIALINCLHRRKQQEREPST